MNLDIFKNSDKSGKYYKESYLAKYHLNELTYINKWCYDNNIDASFKEKVFLAINQITEIPCCKNPTCDNKVNYKNSTIGYYEYCSNRCISSDPEVKNIKRKKSLEKFGTETPAQSIKIKNKIIATNILKYGHKSPLLNVDIKNKANKTLMDNWEIDNPSKSPIILAKRIESFKNNIHQYKASFKKTCLERYGVEHHWSLLKIHKKGIDKSNIIKLENSKNIALNRIPETYHLIDYKLNLGSRSTYTIECPNCKNVFEISSALLYERTIRHNIEICTICNSLNNGISGLELKLLDYIKSIYYGKIITNYRKLGFELDIFLPDKNIAFEFNGLYWHSEKYKDKLYHKNKTDISFKNNISLLHIWEDDWLYRNEIIKSIITNRIGLVKNSIYARRCEIKTVEYNDARIFLEENNINGNIKSSIRIGLYYDGILVSLMVFKKKQKSYELVRFSNKINYQVIGGASKLFMNFVCIYNPNKVICYTDSSIFDGNLFKVLNFIEKPNNKIDFKWIFNKSRISTKTENKIWGCGYKKWVYYKSLL